MMGLKLEPECETFREKKLLYEKLEIIENDYKWNPVALAEAQWYVDDAFVISCPFCKENITRKALTEQEIKEQDNMKIWEED